MENSQKPTFLDCMARVTDPEMHFTIEAIIETLNNMEVANIEDMCYI